jgi:hypothetical protein
MPWVNQQAHWCHGKPVLCGSHTIGDFPILIDFSEFLHITISLLDLEKKLILYSWSSAHSNKRVSI